MKPNRKPIAQPTTCLITKYVDGKPAETEVVLRAPLPNPYGRKELEVFVRRFRVIAEQETGEEHFVAYASTLAECDAFIAIHMAQHPEHRSCWFERL